MIPGIVEHIRTRRHHRHRAAARRARDAAFPEMIVEALKYWLWGRWLFLRFLTGLHDQDDLDRLQSNTRKIWRGRILMDMQILIERRAMQLAPSIAAAILREEAESLRACHTLATGEWQEGEEEVREEHDRWIRTAGRLEAIATGRLK